MEGRLTLADVEELAAAEMDPYWFAFLTGGAGGSGR